MKIEFSRRALADLERLAGYYRTVAGAKIAAEAELRIWQVLDRLREAPSSAVELRERPGIRAAVVQGFPYRIFYRVHGDSIQIAHIRHTSRQPWKAGTKGAPGDE